MSISKSKWQCPICKEILISDPFEHHTMNNCNCGYGVDHEIYCCRILGPIEFIKHIPRNFEKERLIPVWTTYGKNNEFPEGKKISISEMSDGHMKAIVEIEYISERIKWLIKREKRFRLK